MEWFLSFNSLDGFLNRSLIRPTAWFNLQPVLLMDCPNLRPSLFFFLRFYSEREKIPVRISEGIIKII